MLVQKISTSLETIAKSVDQGSDLSKMQEAIKTTRDLIVGATLVVAQKNGRVQDPPLQENTRNLLKELDKELSIWQSKLSVILNEPVGKKGMAKHARFWAEKLRAIHGQ